MKILTLVDEAVERLTREWDYEHRMTPDGQTVNVVAPFNVNASNGVIHTIDTVLLPLHSE